MKVSELKKSVVELKNSMAFEEESNEVINLISRFTEILQEYKDESDCDYKMMPSIKAILNDFWILVVNNLPYEKWQNGSEVAPWLALQQLLVKEGFLEAGFHHFMVYQKLKNYYDDLEENPLKSTDFLPLLVSCSRMLGYAGNKELTVYPLAKLNEKLGAKKPQENIKLNEIMVLLRTIFYLIYHYCTAEQLALLPQLIYFRYPTTEEERRSELAIFNWLSKEPITCLKFFNLHQEDYVDIKAFKDVASLKTVGHLVPTVRNKLIRATSECHWIYPFIQKTRFSSTEKEGDELHDVLSLLEKDFASQKDQSYIAALNFATTIKIHLSLLKPEEAELVNAAHHLFCLAKYIKQRKEDPEVRHSFLSFSGQTKCNAAEKKQLDICGIPVNFGFFEAMALKQGRLKKILEPLQDPKPGAAFV